MTDRAHALAGIVLLAGTLWACNNPVSGPGPADGGAQAAPDAATSAPPDASVANSDASTASHDASAAGPDAAAATPDAGGPDASGGSCSRFNFDMKSNPFTSSDPVSAGAGDFDGDGVPDLAVARFTAKSVEVLRSLGGGMLTKLRTLTISGEGYALAAGDLDGDGKPDLAVAQNGAGPTLPVTVLLNKGSGSFAPGVNYATGFGPPSIALGRFHGTLRADLAVSNLGNYAIQGTPAVSVLLNNANGTFAPKVEYPAGSMPMAIAAGKLDADDLDDLVVSNGYAWNTVAVLLNNGDGTFSPKVEYPTGSDPRALAVLDLDHDGRDDVATADEMAASVSVLLNNGDGTLAAPVAYPVAATPVRIALADLDADGNPDVVVSHFGGGGVAVLPNNGDGTFGAACTLVQGSYGPLALADFDGDGKVDIAAFESAGPVDVLLNRSP